MFSRLTDLGSVSGVLPWLRAHCPAMMPGWVWQGVMLFVRFPKIDLMPHDLITQLLRVLAIETKQEKAMVHADPTELTLSGLEAFSFDYVVKWPLSLIINRCALGSRARSCPRGYWLLGRALPHEPRVGRLGQPQLPSARWSHLVLCSQESPDALPDALQTHVLLQARGAAAVQRLDQQQDGQAALPALRQVVRAGAQAGPAPCTPAQTCGTRPRPPPPRVCAACTRGRPRPLQGVERWHGGSRRPAADALACRFAGAFTLRQRMLNFVQNVQYYMMLEVVEPTWHVLEKSLRSVSSVQPAPRLGVCRAGSGRQGPGPTAPRRGGSMPRTPGLRLLEERILPSEPRRWAGTPFRARGPSAKNVTSPNSRTKSTASTVFCL